MSQTLTDRIQDKRQELIDRAVELHRKAQRAGNPEKRVNYLNEAQYLTYLVVRIDKSDDPSEVEDLLEA